MGIPKQNVEEKRCGTMEEILENPGLCHIVMNISRYLDPKSLAQCRAVCYSWQDLIDNDRRLQAKTSGKLFPCEICEKDFSYQQQLYLHKKVHIFERPYRCDPCSISFRTFGTFQKHKRSTSHFNKVNINATFGEPSSSNPRPFLCSDCNTGFRIHGHLAKHLRSKSHILQLENQGKLPIGLFAEMERIGTNFDEIDTQDCDSSLDSLK